jgi:hypothetical protein
MSNGWGIRRGGGNVLVLTRNRIALKSRRLNALVRRNGIWIVTLDTMQLLPQE